MKLFLLSLALLTTLSVSCQRNTAGVNIPAQQTFILGEYADYAYSAKLKNAGKQLVTVQLRDKTSKAAAKTITLKPGDKAAIDVAESQEVTLENTNAKKAQVDVVMSREVIGMRYVGNDDVPLEQPKISDNITAADAAPNAGPAQRSVSKTLSSGETLILGEGTVAKYSVKLGTLLSDIQVSVRDRKTGEQTQGFGLGRKATVHIREHEVVYLINAGSRRAKVTAEFSAPVRGERVVTK